MIEKCQVCGIIYSTVALPGCGSEDGPTGPKGMPPEMRKFMRCALEAKQTPVEQEQLSPGDGGFLSGITE